MSRNVQTKLYRNDGRASSGGATVTNSDCHLVEMRHLLCWIVFM